MRIKRSFSESSKAKENEEKPKKETEETPPKRRSARLTRSTSLMAEEEIPLPEKPEKSPFIKYRGAIKYFIDGNKIDESAGFVMQWVDKQTDVDIVPMAFDMEWPFSFQAGAGKSSVIQICVDEKCCYIYQLSKLKKLPASLMTLLKHPKVRLHGVNIENDFRKLARDFPEVNADVLIKKCIDLGIWCNEVCETGERWSLERLACFIIKKTMNKSREVRMSKWNVIPLNENQLMYAAIDVYIGQVIYRDLERRAQVKLKIETIFKEEGTPSPDKPEKLPFIKYRGAIKYFTDRNEIAESADLVMQWVDKQTDVDIMPMAFDMEWPFSFETGPGKSSVLQICVDEKCCYVYQLSNLKKLPAALIALLKHPKVRLHGVNIENYFRKLARDFPEVNADVLIKKCIDLGIWCNEVCGTDGRWSLERLANFIVKKALDKSKKVRKSNWNVIPLDKNQLMYAAIDVYIGQVIYRVLERRAQVKQEAVNVLGETFHT